MVILVTGRKDAGKTTYSKRLVQEMLDLDIPAVLLDGDEYRRETDNADFSDEGRVRNLMGAAALAAKMESDGAVVVVAFVSPKKEWRDMMRSVWNVSRLVYLPGGTLWPNTTFEIPDDAEFEIRRNK